MEAWTLAGRARLSRGLEAVCAPGLAPWLLALLIFAGGYAAFANGATATPDESRLQVGVAAIGLLCGVGLVAGALRAGKAHLAWAGLGLLAAFALWSAVSVAWSAAPDETWLAANRAIAYATVATVAMVAAATARGTPAPVAVGMAAITLVVALYALGGKIAPELHFAGLSLDPGSEFSRVREPIGYWNGLAILCVMATPVCIWLAASRDPAASVRIGALLALTIFLLTVATTYSRGALVAYVAVLAVMVGAGPRRLPRLAVGIGAIFAALPSVIVDFGRHDLTTGGLSAGRRADDGLILGIVLLLSLASLALLARELLRAEGTVSWTPGRTRAVWRGLAAAAAVLLIGGAGLLTASGRGPTGEISHQWREFKKPKGGPGNNPGRLVSTNGSNRWIWWEEATGAFSDKPLAGWGAGSFPVVRYLYRRFDAPVRSTHSVPLQFLSETGLVGAALGLGGLGLLGGAAVRRVRASSGAERSARLALLAAATAWAVHSLIDWDWELPAVTIPALVAVAVAAAPAPESRQLPAVRRMPGLLAAAAALTAVLFAASAALPALAEQKRVDALQDAAGGSQRAAASDADLAHKLDPLAVDPLFTEASIATSRRQPRLAASLLSEAGRLQPDNFRTWSRLWFAEVQVGNDAAAARAIRHLAGTDPLGFRGRPNLPADLLFSLQAPPALSPTAFGTPPP